MDIYFINLENIINTVGKARLRREYGNFHHHYSRMILKYLLLKIYNINSPVLDENKRPYIENNEIIFSISHSENLLAIMFDKKRAGIDIEYIRERNYKGVLNYYGLNIPDDISQDEFFQIWTVYEAEYKSKLNTTPLTFKYRNYMCSLSCESNTPLKIYEVTIPTNKIINNELMDLIVVNNNSKNENAVVIQGISIPSSDFLSPSDIKIK